MMIHVLHHGAAFCGQPGLPKDWPEGDRWVGLDHPELSNCHRCLEAVVGMKDRPKNPPVPGWGVLDADGRRIVWHVPEEEARAVYTEKTHAVLVRDLLLTPEDVLSHYADCSPESSWVKIEGKP